MDSPDRTLTRVAASLSAGAGLVHVGLARAHADHHWTMGVAFLLTGAAQLAWTVALLRQPGRPVLALGAGVQVAAVLGLALTAALGWPVGPQAWRPETVSTAAALCLGLELAAVAAAGALLLGRVRLPSLALPLALAVVVASSTGALAAGAGHDGAGHDGTAAGHGVPGHHDGSAGQAALGAHRDGDGHAPQAHVERGQGVAGVEGAGDRTAPHGDSGPHSIGGPHSNGGPHDDLGPDDASGPAGAAPHADSGAAGHGHGPVDTTPPTVAQQAAADELLRASRAALRRYDLASVAEADGYRVVHDAGGRLLHYLHDGHAADGRDLDPQRIESLLYVVLPGGGKLLVGGMFTVPKGRSGPAVGGSLTQWHAHDDLCLDPAQGIAISQRPGGGCPPGSAVATTGEMMHVWAVDYPGGPFGELDPKDLRKAVLDVYGIDGMV